jgi:hypothetical protein
MLTKRENLLETMRGGKPDRFVNQYEFMHMMFHPFLLHSPAPNEGDENIVNAWGVTNSWPAGTPGSFPVHKPETIVIKDIENWKDYVKAPSLDFADAEWEPFIKEAESVDRKDQYVTTFVAPGLFEQCHHLGEIQNTLMNFYMNPDEMKELIKYLEEWEMKLAEGICKNIRPNAIFHHDDWGSQNSTFMKPEMFAEFYLDAYKNIYGYYHDHGVELVVHHSDCYAATLVPYMIDMGVDIWQGCMTTNNIPELIKKYGDKITFMGGIDSAKVDFPGWDRETIRREVKRACDENGKHFFIPCGSQGLAMSTFPGVYETISEEIDAYSKEIFK